MKSWCATFQLSEASNTNASWADYSNCSSQSIQFVARQNLFQKFDHRPDAVLIGTQQQNTGMGSRHITAYIGESFVSRHQESVFSLNDFPQRGVFCAAHSLFDNAQCLIALSAKHLGRRSGEVFIHLDTHFPIPSKGPRCLDEPIRLHMPKRPEYPQVTIADTPLSRLPTSSRRQGSLQSLIPGCAFP